MTCVPQGRQDRSLPVGDVWPLVVRAPPVAANKRHSSSVQRPKNGIDQRAARVNARQRDPRFVRAGASRPLIADTSAGRINGTGARRGTGRRPLCIRCDGPSTASVVAPTAAEPARLPYFRFRFRRCGPVAPEQTSDACSDHRESVRGYSNNRMTRWRRHGRSCPGVRLGAST